MPGKFVSSNFLISVCMLILSNALLIGCVWYVFSYVRKKALLQCLCNYPGEGYRPVCCARVCVFDGFWDRDYVN